MGALSVQANDWIRWQELRDKHFDPDMFSGPMWSLILNLYAGSFEGRTMSGPEARLCTKLPEATAMRWIDLLIKAGFVCQIDPDGETTNAQLGLTARTVETMDRLLDEMAGR